MIKFPNLHDSLVWASAMLWANIALNTGDLDTAKKSYLATTTARKSECLWSELRKTDLIFQFHLCVPESGVDSTNLKKYGSGTLSRLSVNSFPFFIIPLFPDPFHSLRFILLLRVKNTGCALIWWSLPGAEDCLVSWNLNHFLLLKDMWGEGMELERLSARAQCVYACTHQR